MSGRIPSFKSQRNNIGVNGSSPQFYVSLACFLATCGTQYHNAATLDLWIPGNITQKLSDTAALFSYIFDISIKYGIHTKIIYKIISKTHTWTYLLMNTKWKYSPSSRSIRYRDWTRMKRYICWSPSWPTSLGNSGLIPDSVSLKTEKEWVDTQSGL